MSPEAGFILVNQIVPRLRSAIPNVVHCVGAEDTQELVADATCLAAKILDSAETRGKKITAGNAAYYAIEHCKSGRRSVGNSCADAMGTSTQLKGRSRLESLETVVASNEECGGEIFLFHDVLSQDEEDPGTKAARKMDWETFCAGLPERERAMVEFVAEGMSFREVGKKFNVRDSAMQSSKRHLVKAVIEFMGADILIEVQRSPRWKENMAATKEKMACRHERQAA